METTNYEIDVINENEVEVFDRGYDEVYEEPNNGGFVKGVFLGAGLAGLLTLGVIGVKKLTSKDRDAKQIKALEAKGYTVCKIEPTETKVEDVVEDTEAEEN